MCQRCCNSDDCRHHTPSILVIGEHNHARFFYQKIVPIIFLYHIMGCLGSKEKEEAKPQNTGPQITKYDSQILELKMTRDSLAKRRTQVWQDYLFIYVYPSLVIWCCRRRKKEGKRILSSRKKGASNFVHQKEKLLRKDDYCNICILW